MERTGENPPPPPPTAVQDSSNGSSWDWLLTRLRSHWSHTYLELLITCIAFYDDLSDLIGLILMFIFIAHALLIRLSREILPRPSVCPSVTLSFCTVNSKTHWCIFSKLCRWVHHVMGVCCIVGMLFEFYMNTKNWCQKNLEKQFFFISFRVLCYFQQYKMEILKSSPSLNG